MFESDYYMKSTEAQQKYQREDWNKVVKLQAETELSSEQFRREVNAQKGSFLKRLLVKLSSLV